ncbi:ABC transporter substrate-binding protein [Cohnella nanjingensis]|uniref:Carbohydrate ABC transporter substrate-binding protein n=1 Tax=Cohnella nanjingensis TaxID=1387779 RepID=A0A7X0RXR3_9BACL|nr:ABC transporter substrate-binding protein [Cohnella nanjingensis]MBB6675612.1 carbohydrate ABC transporter substrate-binding protein [Cohnella nanjingensis]
MKRVRKTLLQGFVLLLLAGGLPGCGWPGDGSGAAAGPETGKPKAQPVKLVWYHHFREEGARKWLEIGTSRFSQTHPNVAFETIAADASTYASTLHNLVAVEKMPDLYMADSIFALQEFIDAGYAMDLTGLPLIEGLQDDALKGVKTADGKVWAMPFDRNGVGVFYNKAAFAEAGVARVPETWSEFLAACERLRRAGITPIAAGYKDIWTLNADIQPDVIANGVGAPSWIRDIEAGKATFAEDKGGFKGVLKRLAERFKYMGDAPFSTGWNDALKMVASGKAAMIVNGTWTVDGLRSENPDAAFGMFAFPYSEDPADARFAMKTTGGIVVNPRSPNKALALEAARSFGTPEMAEVFQTQKKGISIVPGAPISFDPAFEELDRQYLKTGRSFDYSFFYPEVINQELLAVYQNELTLFLYDPQHDVEKCIRALDEAFDRIRPRR